MEFDHGPARQLEGLFAAVARDMPDRHCFPRPRNPRRSVSTRSTRRPAIGSATSRSTPTPAKRCPTRTSSRATKVDKDRYLEVTKDELENIALESTRTIEIDEFVPRSEIDDLYLVRPYYIVPDGKVGHDAYAVIRETIRSLDKVALGRVVLTNREHVIALEARDKGLMGMLLRYPYEVRDASEYFDDIQDVKITKDMLDLAKHIVEQKSGHFEPAKFEDHYEAALQELLAKKQKGLPIAAAKKAPPSNVVNLMDALRASSEDSGKTALPGKPVKAAKKTSAKPKRKTG